MYFISHHLLFSHNRFSKCTLVVRRKYIYYNLYSREWFARFARSTLKAMFLFPIRTNDSSESIKSYRERIEIRGEHKREIERLKTHVFNVNYKYFCYSNCFVSHVREYYLYIFIELSFDVRSRNEINIHWFFLFFSHFRSQ